MDAYNHICSRNVKALGMEVIALDHFRPNLISEKETE